MMIVLFIPTSVIPLYTHLCIVNGLSFLKKNYFFFVTHDYY